MVSCSLYHNRKHMALYAYMVRQRLYTYLYSLLLGFKALKRSLTRAATWLKPIILKALSGE